MWGSCGGGGWAWNLCLASVICTQGRRCVCIPAANLTAGGGGQALARGCRACSLVLAAYSAPPPCAPSPLSHLLHGMLGAMLIAGRALKAALGTATGLCAAPVCQLSRDGVEVSSHSRLSTRVDRLPGRGHHARHAGNHHMPATRANAAGCWHCHKGMPAYPPCNGSWSRQAAWALESLSPATRKGLGRCCEAGRETCMLTKTIRAGSRQPGSALQSGTAQRCACPGLAWGAASPSTWHSMGRR